MNTPTTAWDRPPTDRELNVLEKSDCPLVQAYRVAWADDVEEFTE